MKIVSLDERRKNKGAAGPAAYSDQYFQYAREFAADHDAGKVHQSLIAREIGVSEAQVHRMRVRWLIDKDDQARAADWEPPEPYSDDPVEDFCQFRAECFQTPEGDPYHTPGFQRKWLASVIRAWMESGCIVVLSPPRHGKTELFTHFCVWLIIRKPNIRIIYIGGSLEIAEQSVESAKDHLESNEHLQRYLPPGKSFMPRVKSGRTWTKSRFTVATRDVTGIKSPTMVAVGRGGRMPSRDADIMIVDDPEDHDSTLHPGTREDTRGWWAKSVMSRKESKTGVFVIGSRVHPDDLTGHLLRSPGWESIVEQAHNSACSIPEDEPARHVDCMLWPEVRSYEWLIDKKNDPLQSMFWAMVYQNEAVDADAAHFTPDDIDACMDPGRKLGHVPPGTTLVAGLDPSVSGFQASFLWAYEMKTGRRFMVDLDNQLGGGVDRAFEIMQGWYARYRCAIWVVEEQLYHGAINADPKIRRWASKNYVVLEGHETWGSNKWDQRFGVAAMSHWLKEEFEDGPERMVSLPVGDEAGRQKVALYRTQMLNFNRDVAARNAGRTRKKPTGDVLMASWFPESVIRRWAQEESQVEITYTQTDYPFAGMDLEVGGWG